MKKMELKKLMLVKLREEKKSKIRQIDVPQKKGNKLP